MIEALLLSIKIGIDPEIFSVIGIEVTWHGLFTALGVVAGVSVATYFARKQAYPEDMIYNVALFLVIGGIIGARALYVIENWSIFENDLGDIFALNTGGISVYGALMGGAVGAWTYAYITKVPNLPRGADIAGMGAIVGMAVGRLGDIINGEHFADSTSLPWGLVYTDANSPSFIQFGPNALAQHPAVAYELIGDMLIFGILVFVYLSVKRAGVTFFAFVFLYGLLRTFVSFLRLDDIVFLGLRTAQIVGIVAMPIGLAGMAQLLRTSPQEERESRAQRRRSLRAGEEPAPEQPTDA
ncbi:MAG: prolipoprotein diacylglyceryl transferase [Chloroflexi bacterium]|nr:prolipoprotein diacylglyceryl transferase [Chloroflexota bacterium]